MWTTEHRRVHGRKALRYPTGRKRHIVVDTLGLLLNVVVQRASVQDRDGTRRLLRDGRRFPSIRKIFADPGYQGPTVAQVVADTGKWQLEIVKRTELHKFVVLPKRRIVERTFAWISRNRGSPATSGAMPAPSSPSSALQ